MGAPRFATEASFAPDGGCSQRAVEGGSDEKQTPKGAQDQGLRRGIDERQEPHDESGERGKEKQRRSVHVVREPLRGHAAPALVVIGTA